jgi:hypothetical protein
MHSRIARFLAVVTVAAALAVAFPQSAGAAGCDKEVTVIRYGAVVKPTDICLSVGPDHTTQLLINSYPDRVTFSLMTCYLNACTATGGSVARSVINSDVGQILCLGPNYCIFADVWHDGTPHVQICYVYTYGTSDCPVQTRAPEVAGRD